MGDYFTSASNWTPPRDPLTLDLDGDGLETVGLNTASPIYFDHDGDGVKTASGWVSADDGFLVLDRNGNGTIDTGAELFGDSTPLTGGGNAVDGFAALAQEDSNADGKVDALDANFANLRVWRDLDQDGASDAGELFTLTELGIASLNVASTGNNTPLGNGNALADLGTYVKTDGSTVQMGDINLAENTFRSRFTDNIALTEQAQSLPDMQGSGRVRNLREAASLSTTLATALGGYAAATTRSEQQAQLDALIEAWSETSAMATTATGAYAGHALTIDFQGVTSGTPEYQAWLDKLSVLERFNGRTFAQVPAGTDPVALTFSSGQMSLLNQSYAALRNSVYGALLMQTRFKPLIDSIDLVLGEDGIALDFSAVQTNLQGRIDTSPADGLKDLIDFNHFSGLSDAGWDGWSMVANAIQTQPPAMIDAVLNDMGLRVPSSFTATSGNDLAFATSGVDYLAGGSGNDVLFGMEGDDHIEGGAGNDIIWGGGGNDYLAASLGNNRLYGESGNDYLMLVDSGTTGTLDGGDGDDTLRVTTETGGTLLGGAGNDTLTADYWTYGSTFVGGTGNDTLTGGHNADVYRFNLGDGQDRITDNQYYAQAGIEDRLVFGAGIAPDDIQLVRSGNDLTFRHINGQDSVTVASWYTTTTYRIEKIEFADGTVWTPNDIKQKDVQMFGSASADGLYGTEGRNLIYGLGGDDFLMLTNSGTTGTLDGGDGDDTLRVTTETGGTLLGGAGNDTLTEDYWTYGSTFVGGTGNDTLTGGHNADVYRFNLGDGQDRITDNQYYAQAGIEDRLVFGAGIAADQIWLRHVGNDLEASIIGTNDKVVIQNWYSSPTYHVEQFKTTDGALTLLDSQIENLVNAMASFAPPAAGQTTLPQTYQDALAGVIAANWQ